MIINRTAAGKRKHFLRNLMKDAVLSMPVSQRKRESLSVARKVARHPLFKRARVVGLYISRPSEVDTGPLFALCRRTGKTVALPVVDVSSRSMRYVPWRWGDPLKKNVYGIREPIQRDSWVELQAHDLMIVPGRAFTRRGGRLGSGGGYFDRFLSRRRHWRTLGVAFRIQCLSSIPTGSQDRPVRTVIFS